MDNLQLLKVIKDPAIKTMKNRRILASFVIASSMYRMNTVNDEDALRLLNANNIMKLVAGNRYSQETIVLDGERGKRYKIYENVNDCITEWLLTFKNSKIKNIWSFDDVMQKMYSMGFKSPCKADLQPFIDSYKLLDIDNAVLKELYPSNKNIVEVPVSKEYVRMVKNENAPASIPKTLHISNITNEEYVPDNTPIAYRKGERLKVYAANLYEDVGSKLPTRSFSGTVWLYDGMEINGRYAIVSAKMNMYKSRDFLLGYVRKCDLKK